MDARHLYENIVETTKALIIVLDADGRIVLFNPACEHLTGYRFEEVKGRTVWDFLPTPGEREPVKAVFNDLRAGHFPNTFQYYWVTKSGALRFIEWSNSAVTDEHGRVTHVIGTGIDVTKQRAAESASRESEVRFRNLAENVPLVFWTRELPSKRISYVSPAYEAIWGRKLVDLDEAFQSFLESIHPDDRERLFRQMERETEAHEAAETEYRILRPDGAVRWIHSRAVPVRDQAGKVYRIAGFAEDITDRKAVEDALSAARQRQKALLDAIPDSVWLSDADGRYVEANRRFGERWGLDPSSMIGKTVFDMFPAPIAEVSAAEDREVLRTGKALHIEKHRVIHGREHWLDVIKVPVTDDAGNVTGIAGVSRDITERKLAEAQRMARDAALRTALVKDMHHRIKNNLQEVVTLVQQLALRHPENAKLLEAVYTRITTIAHVHGLYATTGDRELRLDQIVLRLVSSLKIFYDDRSMQLSIHSPSASVRVTEGEIVPLALIINELIINAIKHSRSGMDTIPVDVALDDAGDCVRITIHGRTGRFPAQFDFDTGVGLGTGLSLVKSLLPAHGALLRFDNVQGPAGTKVHLTLRPPVIALSA